jgi:uncharacterized protein (DUF488 family)
VELLTVGHGTLTEERFGNLLSGAGVELLVDVRRAPGSRRYPHFSRSQMTIWVPTLGIRYGWEPDLGGWRKTDPDSPNTALRNQSFRGYADYMATPPFWSALDALLADAKHLRTSIMCSEAVYWRCHRRLVADAVELTKDVTVLHLDHDGRLSPHHLTEGVRAEDGAIIYDRGESRLR